MTCAEKFNIALWIEIVVIAGFFATGVRRWWRARTGNHGSWSTYRLPALMISSAVLIVLFSARPIALTHPPTNVAPALTPGGLVQIELKKANDEIQYRIEQEDSWFHYKFIFVGALLAAFFTRLTRESNEPLLDFVGSTTTCFVLALACIVALAIDIHLRNNIVVIQQLALWIRHYAEPSLVGTAGSGYQPWELFLRMPGGMHSDEIYGLLFYPHLHFLTWILYMLYLICFQWIAVNPAMPADRKPTVRAIPAEYGEDLLLGGSFLFVHAAFGAFAFVGHFVPGSLKLRAVPFTDCWETGMDAAWFYLLAALLLVA
ncbi:MAG TPA: hypothetical protein VNN08_02325, partial [Thermoanaerobaculia bacterium]|nr:hypothetical protein [Thermoanaerobaculia bacterium]